MASKEQVEVELKVLLDSEADYGRVKTLLGNVPVRVENQENHFFEGLRGQLRARKSVMRIRLSGDKAILTVKESSTLVDGIQRSNESEEVLSHATAESILAGSIPATHNSQLVDRMVAKYELQDGIQEIGLFKNHREVYCWHNHELELDYTTYPFAECWEIEIETAEPERIRSEIVQWLDSHSVNYRFSKTSKFARLLEQKIE